MDKDEDAIRALVATWMRASQAGDVDAVLDLMTEDAVFLLPGREPMRKAEFAAASRAQQGAMVIEGRSDIQEVQVSGDMAFAWAKLHVSVTPNGKPTMERQGHTLTVFRRENGRWRLARDANLLA